ncbi:ATP-dependent DNA helicase RecG [Candidatus Parcubacteria bacterium]|nr:ATP-dependent DNA helicase RecG [Candidatus Parcubacteria bacterium]
MRLDDPLRAHVRLQADQDKALARLGVETVEDLLYHFPRGYGDTAERRPIGELEAGQTAVIFGTLKGLKVKKGWKRRIPMAEGKVTDTTGTVKIIWFHQAYLAKMLGEDSQVRVEGKVSERNGELAFLNPKIESAPDLFTQTAGHTLFPQYPETKGITSNWLYHAVQRVKAAFEMVEDPVPAEILKRYSLPSLKTALVWIHMPKSMTDAEIARKRFAFEEIFFIQLEKELSRQETREKHGFVIEKSASDVEKFVSRFPFSATNAQHRAITAILEDFKKGYPMSRLLEGDVGSGKTAVAATVAYAAVTAKFQVGYMAPTEILARQHFESFISYFRHLPVEIALITGSGCLKFPSKVNPAGYTDISRSQLLKWVLNGQISVLVGTHALIQKNVKFKNLALAIVDEQHRFGISQRQKLVNNHTTIPHLLSMTATPIPRTLALTLYGDLELTLLDEMPAGRKKIITKVVVPEKRPSAYEEIRKELASGRQLFVICPRIDEPDPSKELAVQAKSVKEEAKRLKKDIFPDYRIEILHSKMKPDEKERIMQEFKEKRIDILVSTSVVEVGVSVENASLIVIEGAERFGLAQLHQLRGRVLRGTHQPYCYLFPQSASQKSSERLKALVEAKNGFELAELDLKNRGAGALTGIKQWGISDLGMEAIKNLKMVEAARAEARALVESDPTFTKHPLIKARLEAEVRRIHFE